SPKVKPLHATLARRALLRLDSMAAPDPHSLGVPRPQFPRLCPACLPRYSLQTILRRVLVATIAFPPKDVTALIAWFNASPTRASAASVGTGSASHICGIHFQNLTGTRFQFVFYRGGGPAYQDLVAGHVALMCAEASATLPLLRDGKIKAYGVMAKARWFA